MNNDITNKALKVGSETKGANATVELKSIDLDEIEVTYASAALSKVRAAFMKTCAMPNKDFVDTEAMSKPKALVGCAMSFKNDFLRAETSQAIGNPMMKKVLAEALSPEELKSLSSYSKDNPKDIVPKALKAMTMLKATHEETTDWEKVPSAEREEYLYAKTKKQWEKIDKKELDRDSKKEKEEHEKDAVKDDQSKIKKLKKGKPSEKKSVEEHDLKKDEELDEEDKTKYSKADWEKTDKKELKKDDKKEKEEHEKDAIKDDKDQIKKLKKDEKEDKKDEKEDKEAKAAEYDKLWDSYAAERFNKKKRSELKDSDFLDPERRSFPVVNCKNVRAAVSTWGMYKGSMSFETFKKKLTARAKKLGCEGSLPKSWEEE